MKAITFFFRWYCRRIISQGDINKGIDFLVIAKSVVYIAGKLNKISVKRGKLK